MNTQLFTSITKIVKESRLVFKGEKAATGTTPKPSAPATAAATLSINQQKDKLKVALKGEAKVDLKTTNWSSVQTGIIGRVNKFIKTASKHSKQFKEEMSLKLTSLEVIYKKMARDGFTTEGLQKLNAKLKKLNPQLLAIKTKVDNAKKLLEVAELVLTKEQIKTELKKRLKDLPGIKNLPENLQKVAIQTLLGYSDEILAAAHKSLDVASKGLGLASITLAKAEKIEGALKKFPTKAAQIMAFLDKIPAVKPIIEKIKIYTATIQTVLKATKNCYTGTKLDLNGKKCRIETKKMLTKLEKLIGKKTLPKDIVARIKKYESRIIAAALLDRLGKSQAKLIVKLKAAGLLKRHEKILTLNIFMRILGQLNCKYLDFESSSTKSLALQSSAKLIHSLVSKIPGVKMVIEGGANSTAISTRSIENVRTRILPIAQKIKGLTGSLKAKITSIPQVRQHLAEIMELANATDDKKFQALMVKAKANPAKWFGGGGVFNTLLALQRAESVSGDMTKPDSLFYKGNCTVLTRAVETGGDKIKDRYSRVSFVLDLKAEGKTPKLPKIEIGKLPKTVQETIKTLGKKAVTLFKSAGAVAKDPKVKAAALELGTALKGVGVLLNPAELAKLKTTAAAALYVTTKVQPAIAKVKTAIAKLTDAITKAGGKVPGAPSKTATTKPAELKPKVLKDGETAIFNGVEYTKRGKKYELDSGRLVGETAFNIIIGKKAPTEAYMKAKMEKSFLKGSPEVSYDHKTKTITGTHKDSKGSIKFSYSLLSNSHALNEQKDDISGLLKDTTAKTLAGAKCVGIDISKINAKANSLEDLIKNGKWADALEKIAQKSPIEVITAQACILNIKQADIENIDITKRGKIADSLHTIIPGIYVNSPLNPFLYNKFKAIARADLTGKALDAVINYAKGLSPKLIQALVKVTANQGNAKLINLYLEKAFDSTDTNLTGLNIKLINAYKGDIGKLVTVDHAKFVVANYAKITKATADKILTKFLEDNKYDADFKATYEALYKGGALPKNPSVWAKYIAGTKADVNILNSGIENATSNVKQLSGFITALVKEKPTALTSTVAAANKDLAKKIYKAMITSKNSAMKVNALVLGEEIKKIDTAFQTSSNAQVTAIYLGLANDKSQLYKNRVTAIRVLISTSEYTPQGTSRNAFVKKMKTLLANLAFQSGNFKDIPSDIKLSKPKQAFIKACNAKSTIKMELVDELIKGSTDIGPTKLFEFVDESKHLTNFQRIKILKAIGMEGERAQMIKDLSAGSPTDKLTDNLFRSRSEKDPEKKRKMLLDAYKSIKSTDPKMTSYPIQREVIASIMAEIKSLRATKKPNDAVAAARLEDALDVKDGALDKLAKQGPPAAKELDKRYERITILGARRERARIELRKCSGSGICRPVEVVKKAMSFVKTQKKVDLDMVSKMKTIVDKNPSAAVNKKDYYTMVIRAAEQSKENKYIDKLKPADIKDAELKKRYLALKKDSLGAARLETDPKKKKALLDKVVVADKNRVELAGLYASINTKPAQTIAAGLYLDAKAYSKAKDIIKDPAKVDEGNAEKLILKFPSAQASMKLEIAKARNFYDVMLSLFGTDKNAELSIEDIEAGIAATGNHSITVKKVLNVLKLPRVKFFSVSGDKDSILKFYIDNESKFANWGDAAIKNIQENLGISKAEIKTAKEAKDKAEDAEKVKKRKAAVEAVFKKLGATSLGAEMNIDGITFLGAEMNIDGITFKSDGGNGSLDTDAKWLKDGEFYWKSAKYKGVEITFGVGADDSLVQITSVKDVTEQIALDPITKAELEKQVKAVKAAIDTATSLPTGPAATGSATSLPTGPAATGGATSLPKGPGTTGSATPLSQ